MGEATNYKIILQYDGTSFSGWQKQGNTKNTIQEKLESILSEMSGETVEIHGAGRTDAGVHAEGQVASFKLTGKRVFLCTPIHHHFERKGWTETQIVVRFWILSGIFALMALATLKLR